MPNHCENDLWIHGTLKEQERFILFAESNLSHGTLTDETSKLNFETVLPYPEEFIKIDQKSAELLALLKNMSKDEHEAWIQKHGWPQDGYNSGGYDWCCQTWGTKWNAYQVVQTIRTKSIFYTFQTAWSPPSPVILAFSKAFPELLFTLKFYEQGAAYSGVKKYQYGELIFESNNNNYRGGRGG